MKYSICHMPWHVGGNMYCISQFSRTALHKLHYYHITFVVTFVSCQKFPFVLAGPIVFIMTRRQRQMIKLYNVIHGKLDFVHIPLQTLINQFQKQLLWGEVILKVVSFISHLSKATTTVRKMEVLKNMFWISNKYVVLAFYEMAKTWSRKSGTNMFLLLRLFNWLAWLKMLRGVVWPKDDVVDRVEESGEHVDI